MNRENKNVTASGSSAKASAATRTSMKLMHMLASIQLSGGQSLTIIYAPTVINPEEKYKKKGHKNGKAIKSD